MSLFLLEEDGSGFCVGNDEGEEAILDAGEHTRAAVVIQAGGDGGLAQGSGHGEERGQNSHLVLCD